MANRIISALVGSDSPERKNAFSREKVLHPLIFCMAKLLKQIWLFTFTHLAETEAFQLPAPAVPDTAGDVSFCLAKGLRKAEGDFTPLEKELLPKKDTSMWGPTQVDVQESVLSHANNIADQQMMQAGARMRWMSHKGNVVLTIKALEKPWA